MAKDYFQDIIPPGENSTPPRTFKPRPLPPDQPEAPKQGDAALNIPIQVADAGADDERQGDAPPRGIRNISAPPRQRPMRQPETPNIGGRDFREGPPVLGGIPPRKSLPTMFGVSGWRIGRW